MVEIGKGMLTRRVVGPMEVGPENLVEKDKREVIMGNHAR